MLVEISPIKHSQSIQLNLEKDIPVELVFIIFRYLEVQDLSNVRKVCRRFRAVVIELLDSKVYSAYFRAPLFKKIDSLGKLRDREWFIWRMGSFKIEGISKEFIEQSKAQLECKELTNLGMYKAMRNICLESRNILSAQKREARKIDYCTNIVKAVFLSFIFGMVLFMILTQMKLSKNVNYPMVQPSMSNLTKIADACFVAFRFLYVRPY